MFNLDLIVFLIIIASMVGIGTYKSKQVQEESTYLFGKRNVKWAALTATLVMTEFNSATLISFSSLGYAAGYWALLLPFIFLIGLTFYGLTVAKKWKKYDGVSIAGFFRDKYGKNMGKFASGLLILAMTLFSAAYVKSLLLIFQPLFPNLNPWILSISLLLIIFWMSLRGGLGAIIRTDALSLILMVLFFPLVLFFMQKAPIIAAEIPLIHGPDILPLRFIISLTIITMFTYILAPWYGQKIFAASSPKVAFWSVTSAAILVFFLYGAAIFATAIFRSKGYIAPSNEQALPVLIQTCLPQGLKGAAYALLFATSATTLTGVWSALSSMISFDFLKPQKENAPTRSILLTCLFALISLILANTFVDKVFDKLILANIPVAALAFGLLAGFYWKKVTFIGTCLSIIVGCIAGTLAYFHFGEASGYTWYWAIWGIPLSFLAGIFGSLISRKKVKFAT
ncbi:MAG: hypothetical protein KAR79_02595 [Simkaniaceae bacterium]|nr:hypothetical protein [Simkaniaceae bacterium]